MTTLNFGPLQHKDAIKTLLKPNGLPIQGIYIWGFLYEKVDNGAKCPICKSKKEYEIVDCSNLKKYQSITRNVLKGITENLLFIPYYVGIGSSDNDGIKGRLQNHCDVNNDTFKKYPRLKEDFMQCFHKHTIDMSDGPNRMELPKYPIMKGTSNSNHSWLLLADDLQYYNRRSICKQIFPGISFSPRDEDKNYSIDELNIALNSIPVYDPLKERIDKYNNFWFCYAKLDKPKNKPTQYFHQAEATSFFSLKGITFSRTYALSSRHKFTIKDATGFNIFLKGGPNEFSWPGYF